jgi:uncharacterized membrane protein YqgA involved in biofilm formation
MPGAGVIVNVVAILVGTAIGLLFGKLIPERFRLIAFSAIGLSTMIIGAAMSIGGLSDLGATKVGGYAGLILVVSLVLGAFEQFGHWLQSIAAKRPALSPGKALQPGEKGHNLVEGFVTASLLFCVGAMTVLGSLQDGMGDPSLLYLKSLLDGIASIALATTLGVGVGLSVIPVIVVQGGIALGASTLAPFLTPAVIAGIEMSGGALILCIGMDLAGIKRLPVGNMLPSIVFAAVLAGVLA